jgi:carbon storage regulator
VEFQFFVLSKGIFMLVLSRKEGQKILVGPDIEITVVRVSSHTVRIGIEAPTECKIVREEVELRNSKDSIPSSSSSPTVNS